MISKIISAIGNNSSIYPLLVRDCGIEIPVKVYKTYKQNSDEKEIAYLATRERIIDEYSTSAVWLGGIPLIGKISNIIIKNRGLSPKVGIKLLQAEEKLKVIDEKLKNLKPNEISKDLLKKRAKLYLQSLSGNIEKFSKIQGCEKAVEELVNIKNNQNLYKKMQGWKFFAEMAIPIALMGFIIPKCIYPMTAATRKKREKLKQNIAKKTDVPFNGIEQFKNKSSNIAFGGFSTNLCNYSTVQKMAITDGGYAVGRVATARKKRGAIDIAFKMSGMLYLNFVAPKQIEKILTKTSKQLFNLDVNLDPIILNDKAFIEQASKSAIILPKSDNIVDMLNFVDNKENSKTLFVKYAKELKLISTLKNGVRDPRVFVDETKLSELRNNMENFVKNLCQVKEDATSKVKAIKIDDFKKTALIDKYVKKFVQKAKCAKTFNIISNVAISSYLLAIVLPDAQYLFREKVLGTKLEPDLL